MAARNDVRAARARANHPRPHSSAKTRRTHVRIPSALLAAIAAGLAGVRQRLELVAAVAAVAHAALGSQAADADHDVAVLIQRCIADEIDRQIEQIDGITAMCATVGRKPPSSANAQ